MKFAYPFVIALAKGYYKLFYRYKVYGKEHFYEGGAVIAANHTSFLDPPLLAISWPQEVHFLATDYLFKVPLLGKLITILNSHPVHRGAADLNSIRKICDLLKNGAKVIVFPEGRRSKEGSFAHLKPGIGLIVLKSEAAIIPAYIHGTFEAWPSGKRFPKLFGKTIVVFGSPILPSNFHIEDKKGFQQAIVDKLEHSIRALKKWYDDGAKGIPP